jgi:uncharacterized damage-inducible protein DinB
MTLAQSLLPEFDHEMATTRNLLARVPEDRAAWKPHERSTGLGDLAAHVAQLSAMPVLVMSQEEVDMAPADEGGYKPPRFTTTAALLETFDANVARARAAIAGAADEAMGVTWALKAGGHTIFSMPRVAVLRSFVMNHIIHHRGQLSVYLRLNDVPLPSIYGPTADEQG